MAFLYVRPSDDLALTATFTVNTGSADSVYPAANLGDGLPCKPAKLTSYAGSWVGQLASGAHPVAVIGVIHHDLDSGLSGVKIQANTTNSWTEPAREWTVAIPTAHEDDFTQNAWLDLTVTYPEAEDRTYEYWRLLIPTNSKKVGVGELVLGTSKTTLARGLQPGAQRVERRLIRESRTDSGNLLKYDLGVTERELVGDTILTPSQLTTVMSWWRDCHGRVRGTLIVPDTSANDCMYALFAQPDVQYRRETRDGYPVTLAFSESPRGLPL